MVSLKERSTEGLGHRVAELHRREAALRSVGKWGEAARVAEERAELQARIQGALVPKSRPVTEEEAREKASRINRERWLRVLEREAG